MLVSIWSRLILFAWQPYLEENLCGSSHSGLSAMKEMNKITRLELLSCEKTNEVNWGVLMSFYDIYPESNLAAMMFSETIWQHLFQGEKSFEDVVATE